MKVILKAITSVIVLSLIRFCLIEIKEKIGEERVTVCSHVHAEYLLKNVLSELEIYRNY